ncbi:hypothetical protein ACHAXA_004565 [Cyclostephanos tholiformis]|uniref:Uncharacterized protein n=1 Tax=Cyclostephanos tholiformis TaxID=382380 RepID=A0ABD3RDN7_9STRA
MDVVLPSRILDEIQEAGREVMRAQRRIELLRKALMAEDESPSMASADGTSTGNVENTAAAAGAPITTEASSGVAQPAILAMDDDDGRTAAPTKVRRRKQSPQQHAASVLRQLYQLHPEIANDPVYAAALRMFRVNVGTDIDHHRMNVENCPEVDVICRKILNDDGRMGSGPARHGKKRASSSDGQRRSASDGGEGASGGGGKRRKKGRPPKKSNSGDKLTKGGSAGESIAIRANASWT